MAATEADNVPADERCISLQDDARAEFGNRAVEDDRFLGQPLEERLRSDRECQPLLRRSAGRAIPLCRARRRELCLRERKDGDVEGEPISADDTRRRMHDDVLTECVALGIERLLHDQRPAMQPPSEHGSAAAALVAERELTAPAGAHGVSLERVVGGG